ncbi:MAG: hypothetical protein IKJ91_07140 [Clostridia bacterium]|nr:hypothetical protein [Clostridia bacterium]
MIEFQYKLPAQNIEGRRNGTYNNRELGLPSVLTTTSHRLGDFLHLLRTNIYADRALVFLGGKMMMCDKNWIRDHVHVMKAMRHFEYDLGSFLNFIIDTQREDGQFYELIKQMDDYHWKMVDEDCRILYEEDNLSLVRLELEADIEYLVVEGATYFYRTNGDNEWLRRVLPKLEKGIDYITSDEKRWDKEHGLVKRPFTIDTWDFTNDLNSSNDRRIHDDEPMSIMHGDNSGVYRAMNQLAFFNRRLGNEEKALMWEERAAKIRENMMKYLWNGDFFIHQYHLGHDGIDDLENKRMSLSLPYDINRGVTTVEESRKIIEEYMRRRETTDYFAEWFSIDPPYKKFHKNNPGEYVNGAISPFTAGELAKAAFENGYEEYGWSIIERFMELSERDKTVYFLYFPDSSPQPDGGPSAWGAAALINAVDEGLAGIKDMGVNYDEIYFSPKFPVTDYEELRYFTGYEVSRTIVDVRYIIKNEGMRYDVYSPAKKINAHMLLPKGKKCTKLLVNGIESSFNESIIGDSHYVDIRLENLDAEKISFEIIF